MKYKLSKYVIKRYEPKLETYFFYNAKKELYWHCDYATGVIISCLDGTMTFEELTKIISSNNPQTSIEEIRTTLAETFDFLLREEFICEA